MAAIDKIYMRKEDIPEFFEFLWSIDDDYRKTFPNSCSIVCHTTIGEYVTSMKLVKRFYEDYPDDDVPVACFPRIVDKFLYQHPKTPEYLKNYIERQYAGDVEYLMSELSPKDPRQYSGRFKVTKKVPCEGRIFNTPMTYWTIYPVFYDSTESFRYYRYLNKFISEKYAGADLVGKSYWYGSSDYKFTSLKAVFRYIRKHKFPVGTRIFISDRKYHISSITVDIIPEKS